MRIKPKKIMCAIDFSDFTNLILSHGKSLASEFGSKLYLCHVVQGAVAVSSLGHSYFTYTDMESDRIQYAKDKLAEIAREFNIKCDILVLSGHAADEINKAACENNIDMVIAATHGGSGIKRFLIGSVTDRLIKITSCPLLVLRSKQNTLVSPTQEKIKLKRILVGCDFSPDSGLAFDYALSLAQEFQTQLYLAHVIRPAEHNRLTASNYMEIQGGDYTNWARSEHLDLEEKTAESSRLEKQLSSMVPEESRNWCTPITILLEGQPYKKLIEFADTEQIDMIVLGVHGYSILEKFLVGSTTDRVISQAPCSVLVVRQ